MEIFGNQSAFSCSIAETLEILKPNENLRRSRVPENIYKKLRKDDVKICQETWKVAFAPDESFFAWSCGNQYLVLVPLIKGHSNNNESLMYGDNKLVNFPQHRILDCCSTVYSVAFGSPSHKYESKNGSWNLHKFSKDLILAAGLQNGRIRIWEVYTGRLLLKLMDHTGIVKEVRFAPDGSLHLASASHDSTIKIWNLKDDGNMFKTLKLKNYIFSCAWSPDAQKLVSVGKSRAAYVWNMTTYEIILQLHGHVNTISDCAFSPDGSLIATASFDTKAIIWDSVTGEKLRIMSHLLPQPSLIFASGENGNYVRSVSFSIDGCHLTTVADDGFVRFWDLTLNRNADPVETCCVNDALCCSFSPSGSYLAVGTRSGSVSMVQAPMKIHSLLYLSRMALKSLLLVNKPIIDQIREEMSHLSVNLIDSRLLFCEPRK